MVAGRAFDAVVVGAGALGTSAAYHLARRGRRVALVDRFEPVSQTSPRAAGLSAQLRSTEAMFRIASRSVDLIANFEAETGEPLVCHRSGSLKIARRAADVPALERDVRAALNLGAEVEWLSPAEAARLTPFLRPVGIEAAAYVPGDLYFNPADLPLAYLRAGQRTGVEVVPHTAVTAILRDSGGVGGVRTAAGETLAAPVVVDTAGAWARLVGELADMRIPVVPTRHQLMVTAPIGGVRPSQPIVRIIDSNVYVRPDRGGLMLGGYEPEPAQFDLRRLPEAFRIEDLPLDRTVLDRLAASVAEQFPVFGDAPIREHRGGLPTVTADGLPIVGPVRELPGLYVAAGCNVGGLSTSPAIGQYLSDWIVDGAPSVDLSPLRLDRFGPEWADDAKLAETAAWRYAHHYHSIEP